LSERAYAACDFIIQEGKKVCEQAGADLVVMTIPNAHQLSEHGQKKLLALAGDEKTFDPELPDKRIGETCRNLQIPFIAAGTFLDAADYKVLDPHWNKRGHRRVAQALVRLYKERSSRTIATAAQTTFSASKLVGAR
jgi:hypothetical protein